MILKFVLVLLLIVSAFVLYIAFQPSEFSISREATIRASAEAIFPYIDDSRKMNSWNPWMELDPAAKVSFSGPDSGVGATTSWEGGRDLGSGRAIVIESVRNSVVKTRLEYSKSFVMTQVAEISLKADGAQTIVRWSVSGNNTFIARLACFFMNMDKTVGGTFEKGLAKLKAITEKK